MHYDHDLTAMLAGWTDGERAELAGIFPIVYEELRRTARAQIARDPLSSLQPTALLHEAYLQLSQKKNLTFPSRQHFYAFSSTVMQQILVERARSRNRKKRGGNQSHVTLDESRDPAKDLADCETLLALDRELANLKAIDARKAAVMKLSYFAGMTDQEIATLLDLGIATIKRELRAARLWLSNRIAPNPT